MREHVAFLCMALFAINSACGAGETQHAASAGTGGAHMDGGSGPSDAGTDALPPATPTGNFALWHIYLGDTDFNDVHVPCQELDPSKNPLCWRHIGMNLDGQVSNVASPHCDPYAGADPAKIKVDGDNGIDNSFGENIVPVVKKFLNDFSTK